MICAHYLTSKTLYGGALGYIGGVSGKYLRPKEYYLLHAVQPLYIDHGNNVPCEVLHLEMVIIKYSMSWYPWYIDTPYFL